ncbi:MAG: hypothetical protein DRI95_01900 [Bacteroidetes bacterium]|nr:MAG: hypothetical protein DRI95_01900 [Bacteroidota bacterium]RLD83234.1 MAG: hypothetical protein DRJ07_07030 [Bacteroidota bacterium]
MAKSNSDHLFQLIKSLTAAEKRYFKVFVSKGKDQSDAKFIKLFNLIDKYKAYDEARILEQEKSFKVTQVSNLKAHLYKQILQSLENYNPDDDVEIKIRDLLNYTNLLYNKSLFEQCWKMLEKARQMADANDKVLLLFEIVEFEKKLLTKSIHTDISENVLKLVSESEKMLKSIKSTRIFQNLSIKLYSFYLQIGFIRNSSDFDTASRFLYSSLPAFDEDKLSFNEKMFLYHSFTGYYFFIQDSERGYEYAKKWLQLFEDHPEKIVPKIEYYIKAFNNLLVAQFKLFRLKEFDENSKKFGAITKIPGLNLNFNLQRQIFKYSSIHKIDKYFMLGRFTEGTKIIPEIAKGLEKYENNLDTHSLTIFHYKFACMYFGDEDYQQAIYWLNKIINAKDVNIRSDIHGFARILNLISHWELGNMDIVDYYIRSAYRYLVKKADFHLFQKYILKFLRKLSNISPDELQQAFIDLKKDLKPLKNNAYEKRAFVYFDIISWLESKIGNRSNQLIIREKAMKKIEYHENGGN